MTAAQLSKERNGAAVALPELQEMTIGRARRARILTTTVGSYPVPDWLAALPSEQALLDATRVVFDLQRQAGIDLPTDGELYRFDVNHPDTNGMIDYFVQPARRRAPRRRPARDGGVPRESARCASAASPPAWSIGPIDRRRAEPARGLRARGQRRGRAVQVHAHQPLHAGAHAARRALSRLRGAHARHRRCAGGAGRATCDCACVQVDEANIPGNPADGPLAAEAINRVLDAVQGREGGAFLLRQLRRPDDSERRRGRR